MTILPIQFYDDGSVEVVDTVGQHAGLIDNVDIAFALDPDAETDYRFMDLICPVCGSVSTHPISGGAAPEVMQELFVHVFHFRDDFTDEDATRLGLADKNMDTWQKALDAVEQMVQALEPGGTDRFVIRGFTENQGPLRSGHV